MRGMALFLARAWIFQQQASFFCEEKKRERGWIFRFLGFLAAAE